MFGGVRESPGSWPGAAGGVYESRQVGGGDGIGKNTKQAWVTCYMKDTQGLAGLRGYRTGVRS